MKYGRSKFLEKCEKWSIFFYLEDAQIAQCYKTDAMLILTIVRFLAFEIWSIQSKILVN